MTRKNWDEVHINEAIQASGRSTCDRAHVGCVIVDEERVIVTGYNGSLSDHDHCDDAGHIIVNNSCQRAVHAEENVISFAAKKGISLNGTKAYITHFPCWRCFRLLVGAGVKEIVFAEMKTNKMTREILVEISKSSIILRSYTEGDFKTNLFDKIYKSLA